MPTGIGPFVALAALLALAPARAAPGAGDWSPGLWVDEDVVELRTADPDAEPYWFKVWVAVIDDQLYVRLGSRAAGRIERNTTAPFVGVRIGGREFDRVRAVPAPEVADRVAAEMKEKYWSDIFVRPLPHPLTLRLEPAGP